MASIYDQASADASGQSYGYGYGYGSSEIRHRAFPVPNLPLPIVRFPLEALPMDDGWPARGSLTDPYSDHRWAHPDVVGMGFTASEETTGYNFIMLDE